MKTIFIPYLFWWQKCFLSSLHTSTLYSFCKRSTFYYTLHDFFTLCLSVNFSLKFTSQNWISKSRGVRCRFSRNYQIKLSILRQWFFDVDWVIVCFGACVKLNKANLFYTFFHQKLILLSSFGVDCRLRYCAKFLQYLYSDKAKKGN